MFSHSSWAISEFNIWNRNFFGAVEEQNFVELNSNFIKRQRKHSELMNQQQQHGISSLEIYTNLTHKLPQAHLNGINIHWKTTFFDSSD